MIFFSIFCHKLQNFRKKTKKPFEFFSFSQKAFLTPSRRRFAGRRGKNSDNPVFQLLAGFEAGNAARLDVDLSPRLRVAPDSPFSLGRIESAETGQRDFVVATETFCNVVRHCVDGFFGQGLGTAAILRHIGNQFCFCHSTHPLPLVRFIGLHWKPTLLAGLIYYRVSKGVNSKSLKNEPSGAVTSFIFSLRYD